MKNLFTLLITLVLAGAATAQVFWTENFGTTCQARGNQSYTGPNGTWTISSTGTNETYGNDFYISDRIMYNGVGNCAIGTATACQPFPNNCLHVGGKVIPGVAPVDSSSYWTGFFCSFGFCAATNRRAESPVINCSGKTSVIANFVYYEGGDNTDGLLNGDATMWYYDGSTWSKISELGKTPRNCSGTEYGVFTTFSVSLPASANNNTNVKIGFNWTNDDNSAGTDPSFAVDSIQISGSGSAVLPPVAAITAAGSDSSCAPLYKSFSDNSTNTPTSWLWTFAGGTPSSSTLKNPGVVQWNNAGTYSVTLTATNSGGSSTATLTNLKVIASPPTPSITRSNDTLYCSTDPSYISYQWFHNSDTLVGETHNYFKIPYSGSFNVSVTNSEGCSEAVGTTVGVVSYSFDNDISIYPSPAKNELNITGNWQSTSGLFSIYDILGNKIRQESVKLDHHLVFDIKNLSQGVYFLHIDNEKGRWTGKFIKE